MRGTLKAESNHVDPKSHSCPAVDRRRGGIIEGLLCHGRAAIPRDLAHETAPRLEPFFAAGLCESDGATLAIGPAGLPYARSIAAQFDPYRGHSPRRFSSAV